MPKKPTDSKPAKPAKPGKAALTTTGPGAPAMTLEQITQTMNLLDAGDEDNHWQMGFLYNIAADNKMAEAKGFKGPRDYFAQTVKHVAPTSLTRYSNVARAFTEPQAKTYGCSLLDLLRIYDILAHAGPISGDPGQAVVHVPQKDGTTQDVQFKDCTATQLNHAIDTLKAGAAPIPPSNTTEVDQYNAALKAAFGPHSAKVVAKAKGRGVVYDLVDAPSENFKLTLQALLNSMG
jgi:hypothetical protein